MSKLFSKSGLAGLLLVTLLTACNSGYRTNIQQLISPAALPHLKQSKLIQVSSFDSTGGNRDRITIPPGKKVTILNAEGPGMIVRIWFAIESRDPYYLRRLVLRIFWDHEDKPSVEAPLGDFFGTGFFYKQYVSPLMGMTSGGFVCYLPMPFERSARVEIANETIHEVDGFLYQLEYQKFEAALESDVAYFHAQWKRDIRTNYDSNYTVLIAEGKGHLIGVNLNLQSYDGRFTYLEGDDMIYVDGEKRPSIRGTGTEDYFSGGWYFNQGEFAGPHSGLIYKNDSLGQIAAYRFYLTDPVPFKKNIRVTFEHGHGNQDIADYSSTAYWYQTEPHKPFQRFPGPGHRIPLRIVKPARMIEAEKLKFNLNGLPAKIMDMSGSGPDWSGDSQFVVEGRPGASFELEINGLKESKYDMEIYFTRGPEYGNAEVVVNGTKAGVINGYSPTLLPDGKLTVKGLTTLTGSISLRFDITGKDPLSKGFSVGLDAFNMVPDRVFIPDWYVLGPFQNPHRPGFQRKGIDTVYMPEKLVDLRMPYYGAGRTPIRWKYLATPGNGCVSLAGTISPAEQVVSYAVTYIHSPVATNALLFFGSDDGIKVFCNGKELYRFLGDRVAEPDQSEVELPLQAGWNTLLLKIENNFGAYAFYARLADPKGQFTVSADKKPRTVRP